jgi:hypothetical protein
MEAKTAVINAAGFVTATFLCNVLFLEPTAAPPVL